MQFRLSIPKKPEVGREFDLIIVGAGPAGMAAGLYAARFGLKPIIIGEEIGGALADAGEVDDYPGIISVQGPDLAKRFENHVRKYDVPIIRDRVVSIEKSGNAFIVELLDGTFYRSRSLILAVGSVRRKLGVPGEDVFNGKGVSYCAPCDAPLFKGKVTAVVGGGNSALQAALLMTSYSPKVYLIHRRDKFRAFPVYINRVMNDQRIQLVLNTVVRRIGGSRNVEWVEVENTVTGEAERVRVGGVIVEIGSDPPKDFFESIGIRTDEKGYVVVGPAQETNIRGLFAAGDCTAGPHKKKFDQVVVAAAEGAIAALSAYEYLTLGSVETGY